MSSTGKTRVWLALENLQITGSFKVRGALLALHAAHASGVRRVATSSAGNHGAGVAHAANVLGLEAVVVVPASAPARKVAAMKERGAVVLSVDGNYDDAEDEAKALARDESIPFVSPYDDEDVLAGNGGSLAWEIAGALGRVPERVVAPIGGGGLACGLAWGLAAAAGEDPRLSRRVWTVQGERSAAFALSLERGGAVKALAPSGPTLAEGLEGGISTSAFARVSGVVQGVTVVSEAQIEAAMRDAWRRLGLRLEGSAAVGLAMALSRDGQEPTVSGDTVIVLTGRNVDDRVFHRVVGGMGPC